jgi:hypothetical protein
VLGNSEAKIVLLCRAETHPVGNTRHQGEAKLGEFVLPQADRADLVAARLAPKHEVATTGAGVKIGILIVHADPEGRWAKNKKGRRTPLFSVDRIQPEIS